MACDSNKFILNPGLSNEFIITIKQTGTTLPMEIDVADTFTAYLYEKSSNTVQLTLTPTIEDAQSGKIKLVFDDTAVNALTSERGDKVDKYYLKPTYSLSIDCDTVNNGKFVAKIAEVFVG